MLVGVSQNSSLKPAEAELVAIFVQHSSGEVDGFWIAGLRQVGDDGSSHHGTFGRDEVEDLCDFVEGLSCGVVSGGAYDQVGSKLRDGYYLCVSA